MWTLSALNATLPVSSPRTTAVRRLALLFFFFLVLGTALHYSGLHSPMIYDSQAGISDKAAIFAGGDLRQIMGMVPGRPLFMLSLHLNYLLTGMDPVFFRLTNVAILAGTGLAVVLLTMALLQIPGSGRGRTEREKWIISSLVGLWFVVHPIQSFVVLYIWQRQALLACFFYFLALAVYVAGRSDGLRPMSLVYPLTGALFLAALLTKESAVSLPVAMALAELTLLRGTFRETMRRLAVVVVICGPVMVVYSLVNLALQGPETVHTRGVINLLVDNYRMAQLTLFQVVETQCRVLLTYFRMVFVPFIGSFSLVKAEIISRSLWNPPATAWAVAGVIVLLGFGIWLASRRLLAGFGILFFILTAIPEGILSPQYLFFGYRPVLFMVGLLIAAGELVDVLLLRLGNHKDKTGLPGLTPPTRCYAGTASKGSDTVGCNTLGVFGRGVCGETFLQKGFPSESPFSAKRTVLAIGTAIVVCAWTVCLGMVTVQVARNWNPFSLWQLAFSELPRLSENVEKRSYQDILINFGNEMLRVGRYGEAVEIFRKAVAINPDLELAHTKLAVALQRSGETGDAIESYRKAALKNPSDATVLANLGDALIKTGSTAEGIEILRRAVKQSPKDESARLKLGMALLQTGSSEEGVRHLQEAANGHPSSAAARVHWGVALQKTGKNAQAVEQFKKAMELDPRLAPAHMALGMALEEQGNMKEAQELFRKAVAIDDRSADAHFHLANCLMKQGKLEESVKSYNRALELRPGYAAARANLGTVLLELGRIPDAVANLEKALEQIRDNAELHNALGAALAEEGRIADAGRHFKSALEIDPNHAAAKQNLERMRQETGQ